MVQFLRVMGESSRATRSLAHKVLTKAAKAMTVPVFYDDCKKKRISKLYLREMVH